MMTLLRNWLNDSGRWQWRICWRCWQLTGCPERHRFYCSGAR